MLAPDNLPRVAGAVRRPQSGTTETRHDAIPSEHLIEIICSSIEKTSHAHSSQRRRCLAKLLARLQPIDDDLSAVGLDRSVDQYSTYRARDFDSGNRTEPAQEL